MAVLPSYPGVYVEEVPSGVRTIIGVSTSIGMFVGRTGQGPLDRPTRCLNYTTFEKTFSKDVSVGDMARYVRLFFQNGGTDCYVMRIAHGAEPAEVTLRSESQPSGAPSPTPVLRLMAKQPGTLGESIRAEVSYRGPQPEVGFNMRLFRWAEDHRGNSEQADLEEWINLTMDPNAPNYAVDVLSQRSRLVNAEAADGTAIQGYSLSGRPIVYDVVSGDEEETARNFLGALRGLITADHYRFEISVDGSGFARVYLSTVAIPTEGTSVDDAADALAPLIQNAIHTGLGGLGAGSTTVAVSFETGPIPGTDQESRLLRISSEHNGNVFIRPASDNDLAVPLMLGTDQGGLEVGAYTLCRPAPNGITLGFIDSDGEPLFSDLAALPQRDPVTLTITDAGVDHPVALHLDMTAPGEPLYLGTGGSFDGVREALDTAVQAINDYRAANSDSFRWQAERWGYRLALLPTREDDNATGTLSVSGTDWTTPSSTQNVRRYAIGTTGAGDFQTGGADGANGTAPGPDDYLNAYDIIDKEVDLFNLLVLPPDRDTALDMSLLWSGASTRCEARRAFLLMDPPSDWTDAQGAASGVATLRAGVVKDFSAVFYPNLTIREGTVREGFREVTVGPSGAIAGLMARIDAARGVWKAPAGTEADLRGVVGVQYRFSDGENGVLNPRAINTIRVFPNGIVNWGARTLDGDDYDASEWKYIPIRRLALFIEESLYRGLKWVVFEPNDEPLWAQIRLNVGAFMRNLFRQGAFQGRSPLEAYFVKCDAETTTQDDRNRGIVNIWVGFAPLKPAEFVILHLQQMAGQIEV